MPQLVLRFCIIILLYVGEALLLYAQTHVHSQLYGWDEAWNLYSNKSLIKYLKLWC